MAIAIVISILSYALATQCGIRAERYASKMQDGLSAVSVLGVMMWVAVGSMAGVASAFIG